MPFISEDLWQRLPRPADAPKSVALARLPDASTGRPDSAGEREMEIVHDVIGAVRTIRSERDIKTKIPLVLRSPDAAVCALLEEEREAIAFLTQVETLTIEPSGGERPRGAAMSAAAGVEVLVLLRGIVDAAKERERVAREIKKTEKDIEMLEKTLGGKGFADRAPPEVVKEKQDLLAAARERRRLLDEAMKLADEL
jgi:valyl-tRNA synthetase